MKLYFLVSALIFPFALCFEASCRYSDRHAMHAVPRPPFRSVGRHTSRYVRRHGVLVRIGSQPEVTHAA